MRIQSDTYGRNPDSSVTICDKKDAIDPEPIVQLKEGILSQQGWENSKHGKLSLFRLIMLF